MCEEWNENKPLTQGTAERDFGMDLPEIETRNQKQVVGYPPLLGTPRLSVARGEEEENKEVMMIFMTILGAWVMGLGTPKLGGS